MIWLTSGVSGCILTTQTIAVEKEAKFCDVEERRRFSKLELEWRAANAPTNLKKDFKTNKTGERECSW